MATLGQLVGSDLIEDFSNWEFSEIEIVLQALSKEDATDLKQVEKLQRESLRGADLISDYLSKMVKTVSFLESKLNSVKNKAALDYSPPKEGSRVTADVRRLVAESAPEVEEISGQLARCRGAKVFLEKKFDILIRAHYFYKEVAGGLRRTTLGRDNGSQTEW